MVLFLVIWAGDEFEYELLNRFFAEHLVNITPSSFVFAPSSPILCYFVLSMIPFSSFSLPSIMKFSGIIWMFKQLMFSCVLCLLLATSSLPTVDIVDQLQSKQSCTQLTEHALTYLSQRLRGKLFVRQIKCITSSRFKFVLV